MARRSTKLLRFENTLYRYRREDQNWSIDSVNENITKDRVDIFDQGTYATCKHMSQKVNPNVFRLGFTKEWLSTVFLDYNQDISRKNKFYLHLFLQNYLKSSLSTLRAFLNKVEFKEVNNIFFVNVFYYVPNRINKKDIQILDRKKKRFEQKFGGVSAELTQLPFFDEITTDLKEKTLSLNLEKYSSYLENMILKIYSTQVKVNFYQNKDISESPTLIADFISRELENSNANFKKALKETFRELKGTSKIRGIRVNCSGRLVKAPMAKTEWFKFGQIPLSKMNTNLAFAKSIAHTKYGSIGTKVWVYYYD